MADTPNAPNYSTPQTFDPKTKCFNWVLNGVSKGKPVKVSEWRDRTVQAYSSAWGAAVLVLEGCLFPNGDPDHPDYANAVFTTLTDTTETAISTSATNLPVTQVLQGPVLWVRPSTSGGTASVINVSLMVGK